jgi:predicted Zn-dependent peptidase
MVHATMAAQSVPDRSRPPAPGPVPALALPAIHKHTLSNGLPVWLVEMHEVPIVNVTLIVKSGGAADPAGKFGAAHYTAAMLDEGAGSRDALALADAADFLGASLATSSSFDASTVTLRSLVSTFDDALPLMADVVLRPTFPQGEMDRLRTERQTSLLQIRDNAAQLASAAFARLLYGREYRYGTSLMGTEQTNQSLTTSDLRTFYQAHYQPANAHLIVAGDVTGATILPKLERALGAWKNAGAITSASLSEAKRPASRHVYLVDKPGAAQSQIRIGTVGVARSTPDYFTLDVLNTILGGSFTSRLNQNLREEHGYSYGAGSSFAMRLSAGPFSAQAGVQSDKTAESLTEFFKELDGMGAPVPADELTRAKNLQALSFPGEFETAGNMTARLAELVVYGLPDRYFDQYVQRIQGVTGTDVQRAARQYLASGQMIVVVAGDLATIEKPIRAANVGPVTVVPVDEVLR